jgi:hypothetical protein
VLKQPCDALRGNLPPTMVLQEELPLVSAAARNNGRISIYRFTAPAAKPMRLRTLVPRMEQDLDKLFDR